MHMRRRIIFVAILAALAVRVTDHGQDLIPVACAASSSMTTRKLVDTPLASVIATGGQVKLVRLAANTWQTTGDSNCPDGITYPGGYAKCFSSETAYLQSCHKATCSADEVWSPTARKCIPIVDFGCQHTNNYMTMQDWDGCSALATPATGGNNFTAGPCLIDNRDGKTYNVRKFADGKCWMADNLKYGGDYHYWHDIKGKGVDMCADRLASVYQADGYTQVVTDKTAADAPAGRFWYGSYGDCLYPYSSVSASDSSQKLGYFYNWMAATQSPCGISGQDCNPDARIVNINDSGYHGTQYLQGVCPEGWHIPTGGSDGEWSILVDRVAGIVSGNNHITNETGLTNTCNDMASSCYVGAGTSRNGGSGSHVVAFFKKGGGFNTIQYTGRTSFNYDTDCSELIVRLIFIGGESMYWSSTAKTQDRAYHIYYSADRVGALGFMPGISKYLGMPIRCVQSN